MTDSMKIMLNDKHQGSTILRDDNQGVVIRNSAGGIQKISESMAHNYSVTAGERSKRQHNSDLTAQAKATVQAERQANRQAKADAQAAISKEVAAKRAQRDNEHDAFTKYGV